MKQLIALYRKRHKPFVSRLQQSLNRKYNIVNYSVSTPLRPACLLIAVIFNLSGMASSLAQWTKADLDRMLVSEFHPYPTYGDKQWMDVPDTVRNVYIHSAEKVLHTTWQSLPATLFMEFAANGNRNNYQAVYFDKRKKLNTLIMGEMFERKGRFLPDIVNGIWSVCEESWWGLPAHYNGKLPDIQQNQTVALYTSQTAGDLAWTQYLFRKELDSISPQLNRRIQYELKRRMLDPCSKETYWWMKAENNWNPWICSNWLAVTLLSDEPRNQKIEIVQQILKSLDIFYSFYPNDGGCDEGPGYWANASGALFDCAYLLHLATQGGIDLSGEEKFRNMGNFISRIYMGQNRFINHGDASAKTNLHPGIVFNYGKFIGSEQLKSFATLRRDELIRDQQPLATGKGESMGRFIYTFCHLKELMAQSSAIPFERDVYLPDLQLFATRCKAGSDKGLALAMKGGHNDQSHNHNDVGSYIVYTDGIPLLVDVGPEAYSGKTFTNERYTIWTTRSLYHNAPIINGTEQAPGKQYKATQLKADIRKSYASFSLDIAQAYPAEAKVQRWIRSATLLRNKNEIKFEENYRLESYQSPSSIILMTSARPDLQSEGVIGLNLNGKTFQINYNPDQLKPEIEKIELTDEGLRKMWNTMYRIHLKIKSEENANQIRYLIKQTY